MEMESLNLILNHQIIKGVFVEEEMRSIFIKGSSGFRAKKAFIFELESLNHRGGKKEMEMEKKNGYVYVGEGAEFFRAKRERMVT